MTPLTGPIIAARTLAILDAEGIAGFSMRNVARALQVTPMALYHHFRSKAELAEMVLQCANGEFPFPEAVDDWQENLWLIAAYGRKNSLAHPALGDLRYTYAAWTSSSHILAERWMTSWQQSGLDAERALRAATTSSAAISGLVSDEMGKRRRRFKPSNPDLPSLPGADLLLSTSGDADEMFDLGVHAIVEGLHARLMREQRAAQGSGSAEP